ncbi:hypothetical protein OH76DRAFT_1198412 [Lentinus brumalis]|uniref:Uncharacterized protein n=1 Tax=Lentinus brumalis TaxID=2498619 RepID=A0A371CTC4_9APHY|nr:hypothetical protein OH76DRAFT_1198412 [Polyporus brumalis]
MRSSPSPSSARRPPFTSASTPHDATLILGPSSSSSIPPITDRRPSSSASEAPHVPASPRTPPTLASHESRRPPPPPRPPDVATTPISIFIESLMGSDSSIHGRYANALQEQFATTLGRRLRIRLRAGEPKRLTSDLSDAEGTILYSRVLTCIIVRCVDQYLHSLALPLLREERTQSVRKAHTTPGNFLAPDSRCRLTLHLANSHCRIVH